MDRDLIRGTLEIRIAIEYLGKGDAIVHIASGTFNEDESDPYAHDSAMRFFANFDDYTMKKGVLDEKSKKSLLEDYGIVGLQIEKYSRRLLVEEIFKREWEDEEVESCTK